MLLDNFCNTELVYCASAVYEMSVGDQDKIQGL